MRSLILTAFALLVLGLFTAIPAGGYVEISDQQMNSFLTQLDRKLNGKYSSIISQIRQAWMARDMARYDSLSSQLASTIARDYKIIPPPKSKEKHQPTGGCANIGGHNCNCGPSVWCCCLFPCSTTLNLCIGGDFGGIIGGGGFGGGGGSLHEYICRPSQKDKAR